MVVFFFQAEDGIRDLVRSRGLGDVYKRQDDSNVCSRDCAGCVGAVALPDEPAPAAFGTDICAVSYTHLTLPTSDLV